MGLNGFIFTRGNMRPDDVMMLKTQLAGRRDLMKVIYSRNTDFCNDNDGKSVFNVD